MRSAPAGSARSDAIAASTFPIFALLYLALFAAYGTESPFFPSLLAFRGLSPQQIGVLLSAGTAVRILSSLGLGVVADRYGARLVLACSVLGTAVIILLYLQGTTFPTLLGVCLVHSVATAPLNPLVDVLALEAIARGAPFPYGWLRGIGSAGFIAGTLASGLIVSRFGLPSIIVVASLLFFTMLAPLVRLPPVTAGHPDSRRVRVAELFALPRFRAVLIVSSLVIGSHAMSDAFAVIHWRGAGIGDGAIGLLWSEAVASEVLIFIVIGPRLLHRLGPALCAALAATAGVIRWTVLANSTVLPALVVTQGLHGLTFSLMHLACMQIIATVVPHGLTATAQALYGTFCLGIVSSLLTILSGLAYGAYGGHAFWLMAAICLAAIPLTSRLSDAEPSCSRSARR